METTCIVRHSIPESSSSLEFEEAYYTTSLRYSLRHLLLLEDLHQEIVSEALQKSLQVCLLLGVNSRHHFRKIYVFDSASNELQTDWLMSRHGFNLMVMQLPSQNEKLAQWLWELAE
jgi:hypothetical protein